MKKISIIIPVYNVDKYISDCINSVINQTLKDIEILCIDDASTDDSLNIMKSYAENDERIKIIEYSENKSASQGRKDGVMQSDSEYILFLDGDDYLECNACEELYDEIKRRDVDILHFGTNIINEKNLAQKRIDFIESLLVPYHKELRGADVFEGCFVDEKYKFSLWNKIYRSSLCKKAFLHVKDGSFPKAQDLYAFFILSYFAKSYYGISNSYINYRYGVGITGNITISIKQLNIYCTGVYIAEAIEEFIRNENKLEVYGSVVQKIRGNLLADCLGNWFRYLPDQYSTEGFALITKYWKDSELVSSLYKKFHSRQKELAQKLFGTDILSSEKEMGIKMIGLLFHTSRELQQEITRLKKQNNKLKNSFSYRAGLKLTMFPRFIARIIRKFK